MTDVIGRGVVAIGADTTGATAGVERVKRSVKSLGDVADKAATRNSASIDRYVQKLTTQANTFGRTNREIELYTLRLRGASAAQLAAADTSLRLIERQQTLERTLASASKWGARAGLAIGAGLSIAAYALDSLIKRVGDFQDIAEKVGDTATNVASLSVAAAVGGAAMDSVATAAVKLSKNLLGVDDDSKDAGAAVAYLGLNLRDLKLQAPSEQLRTIAKAMTQLEDDTSKTQVAVALFGRAGAEMLPFLKELGNETQRYSVLTAEQIKIADDYADTQARVLEITKQTIAGFAIDYIPAITETISATAEWIKSSGLADDALTLLRGTLKVAGIGLQTIALIASDVAFVFQGVGREIGAIAAQLVALATLDFSGFTAISEAVREDAARARKELDKYQARLASIGNEQTEALDKSYQTLEDRRLKGNRVKRAPFTGGTGGSKKAKTDNTAAQEAKAQLAYDIELLKQESDSIRTIFAADSKLLEARRSANLISEREYFNEKRNLLILNQQEAERSIEKEIARLESEKLAGKDAIDNARKVLKAKTELQKLRTTGDADIAVLNIQEADSVAKITRAYQDAKVAAQDYIATVARRNRSDIEGLGRGDKERSRLQGLEAIEDRFLGEKSRIERDKRNAGNNEQLKAQLDQYLQVARETYAQEVQLFNERTIAIEQKQRDWLTGYNEAINNYVDSSRNIADQTQQVFENLFSSLEDTISQFVKTGKLDIKSLFDSIASDIVRSGVKQMLGEVFAAAKADPTSIAGRLLGGLGALIGSGPAAGAPTAAGATEAAGTAVAAAGTAATTAAQTAAATAQTAAITANTAAFAASTGSVSAAAASVAALATAEGAASATIAAASATAVAALTTLAGAAAAATSALSTVAASSVASGGGSMTSLLAAFTGAPGRAIGGPVSAGGLYRVNERGPELLQVAGKEYLMMGSQGGKVQPNAGTGRSGPDIIQVNVTQAPGSSRETATQWGAQVGRSISVARHRNGR